MNYDTQPIANLMDKSIRKLKATLTICTCKTEPEYRNCANFDCVRFKEDI